MKTKLVFENTAKLDPRAFTILGLSAKESDNPIGYFGTGLKYAIAILLRTGHQVEITSYENHWKFGTQEIDFRGQKATIITLSTNNQSPVELGFTTELGKNWKVWQAYRELASNCMDEKGIIRKVPAGFSTTHATCIHVYGEEIVKEGHEKHNEIFLASVPLHTHSACDIHANRGNGIYYKGVKVGEMQRPSIWTYNIKRDVELTEDRTIKYSCDVLYKIADALVHLTDKAALATFFSRTHSNIYEGLIPFGNTSPSEEFLDAATNAIKADHTRVSGSIKALIKTTRGNTATLIAYTPTPMESRRVAAVVAMFTKFGYEIPPLKFCTTDNDELFGFVTPDKQIYITNSGLSRGLGDLAITVLEEYHHAVKDFDDYSRTYQDYLLRQIVNFIAEKTETDI